MSYDEICAAIPHRPPFLLLDEIVERDAERIVCLRTFRPDEYFYAGHYPDQPITPGVLLCEAALQAGAVLVSQHLGDAPMGSVPVATRLSDVRFKRVVRPGETIRIEVGLTERLADAFFMWGKITCQGQLAVRLELACTLARMQ